MTRILINTALNLLRKRHQIINWSNPEEIIGEIEVLPLQHYQIDELIGFIQQLPTGCQLVFNLYAIEGYSHKEIAQQLDISEGTSKSQLHRAKQLLQTVILNDDLRTKRKAV